MALISCRECNHQMSGGAEQCPHCGGTGKQPGFDLFTSTAILAIGGLSVIAKLALGVSANSVQVIDKVAVQELQNPTCISNWHKCKDMNELINSYHGVSYVRADCRREATRIAKYGEPKFPDTHLPFNTYPRSSIEFLQTGVVHLLELDAQYPNQLGVYVRNPVACRFDLNRKEVIDLKLVLSR